MKEGQPVTMTRKAVETLLVLVENAGQVVSKEELLTAIWPDRIVEEANLTQNIAMVRRALAAEHDSPAHIETFPGRGYRLTGPVTVDTPPTGAIETPETPPQAMGKSRLKVGLVPAVVVTVIILLLAWYWWSRVRRAEEAGFRVAPLTRLPGEERQPTLSADGRQLAFLWQEGAGHLPVLCVQQVGGSEFRKLTAEGGHDSSPAWSPDGRALAYLHATRTSTEVRLRTLESGEERLVAQFTPPNYGSQRRLLDWSPDGQWLAVSHTDSPEKPNCLFLIAVATGEKKKLTEPEAMVGGDMDPRFSPDSRTITFTRNIHRSQQEIFSISVAGGTPRQLTSDGKQISSHDWLADGSRIVFASDRGGEFRLWRLPANSTSTANSPEAMGIYGEYPMEISISRQAPVLVYSAQPQDRNIWRLDLQEKSWTRLIASSAQDASPRYSPSGDRICFRSDRTGSEQLWVSDANGENQVQITRDPLYPSVGQWSPDGGKIVFNNARTREIYQAQQVDSLRWEVRRLAFSGVHPLFSLDGQWIYAGTPSRILRIPVAGGPAGEIVQTGGFSLALSPDGTYLYFVRDANDTVLWRARTDTGEFSRAIEGLIPNCTSCWAIDDRGIYYLGGVRESFDLQAIYVFDFAGGRARVVLKYPEPLAPVGSGPFSLSPDRRSLLVVRTDPSNSDILKVEPFR